MKITTYNEKWIGTRVYVADASFKAGGFTGTVAGVNESHCFYSVRIDDYCFSDPSFVENIKGSVWEYPALHHHCKKKHITVL